jgi:hypothetical protein
VDGIGLPHADVVPAFSAIVLPMITVERRVTLENDINVVQIVSLLDNRVHDGPDGR